MLKIQIAQLNFHTGAIFENAKKIIAAIKAAQVDHIDVLVFPELALTGYPPEDLLLRKDFYQDINKAMQQIIAATQKTTVVLGYPHKTDTGCYNAAAVIRQEKIIAHYYKQNLPNYGVFDEKRYFIAGDKACVVEVNKIKLGITICEDLWTPAPISQSKEAGAQIILSLNASPFNIGKIEQRYEVMRARQKETGLPIIYANIIGGQDELVFDGASFALDKRGQYVAQGNLFIEDSIDIDVNDHGEIEINTNCPEAYPAVDVLAYNALVLGVKDYIEKNNFQGAVLGLSGGIDSALTLAIAVDAIGAENVQAVMMPTRYTSDMSLKDAEAEAKTLKVKYSVIPIERAYTTFLDLLNNEFTGHQVDTTEENIQARCRGLILMAISNKTGKLVLTTGNKSEMSVGYATLYGDMAGGFAVLKDVSKMLVYRLAKYRNSVSQVIPKRVIDRPPSAELAADQKDEDSLPPYPILDAILERYVEQDQSLGEIARAGYDRDTVERVIKMVKRNEYKRRQAPPGPRLSPRAYGRDRRYPITSGY